ncbi:MAG: NRDE family protein [Cyclobacteriaceae bacterium]|nr:NRDE family protein [Cyclobacteriaceae bacterium]
MCLIFFSVNHHPRYRLVIAGNRDEFYKRKTAPADFWPEAPHVLAGRDLEANGTWLGISRKGQVSLLTNFRDPKNINPAAPSRGHLVSDFLLGDADGMDYIHKVEQIGNRYNGFNLIAGTPGSLWYYSNYGSGVQQVPVGIHGLSNHLINTPWPKVVNGKKQFEAHLNANTIEPEQLLDFLYDDRVASDDQLPDTGVGLERERMLSSMFIKSPEYGSRSSTVILVDHNNHVQFVERVYDLATFAHTTRSFEFDVD